MPSIKSFFESIYYSRISYELSFKLSDAIQYVLHTAIDKGYTRAVWAISFLPINFNLRRNGRTPIELAAYKKNLEVVRILLKIKAVRDDMARMSTGLGLSPEIIDLLNCAASDGRFWPTYSLGFEFDVVQELLKIPAVKNNIAAHNNLVLRHAADKRRNSHQNWPVVLALLQIPAVRENAAANNNEVLKSAYDEDQLSVIQDLMAIESVKNNTASCNLFFLCAIKIGNLPLVQQLMKLPDIRDYMTRSPHSALRAATVVGNLSIFHELLKIPAVKNELASDDHNFIFKSAAFKGHLSVVQELLKIDAVRDNVAKDSQQILLSLTLYPESYSILLAKDIMLPLGITTQTLNKITPIGDVIFSGESVASLLARSVDGRVVLASIESALHQQNTLQIAMAYYWRKYYKTLCNNIKLAVDSTFDFQDKKYSTTCPISLEVMANPIVLTTREFCKDDEQKVYEHIFDKKSILNWFKLAKTNPLNKLPCSESDLRDFSELKTFIRDEGKSKAASITKI